jgi:hypothetical protein
VRRFLKFGLFIDDIRNPEDIWSPAMLEEAKLTGIIWKVARTPDEAIEHWHHYVFDIVSFDHDLGGELTTMPFIRYIIDHDMNRGCNLTGTFIPEPFVYHVHSANYHGSRNITGLLESYLNFRRNT